MNTFGFIGTGNMGGALARACAQAVFNEKLLLSDSYAPVAEKLAQELEAGEQYVKAAVELIDEGNTIPFIARYRKEMHGSMDDQLLRTLEEGEWEELYRAYGLTTVDMP